MRRGLTCVAGCEWKDSSKGLSTGTAECSGGEVNLSGRFRRRLEGLVMCGFFQLELLGAVSERFGRQSAECETRRLVWMQTGDGLRVPRAGSLSVPNQFNGSVLCVCGEASCQSVDAKSLSSSFVVACPARVGMISERVPGDQSLGL